MLQCQGTSYPQLEREYGVNRSTISVWVKQLFPIRISENEIVKWVQRHMAELGLCCVVVKKYKHHANHGTIPDGKVNILKRDFGTKTINQKWCTDITYIHVQEEGFLYSLSALML